MTKSLKLLDELMGSLMSKELHTKLVELREAMEAESAHEQNQNARLQAKLAEATPRPSP